MRNEARLSAISPAQSLLSVAFVVMVGLTPLQALASGWVLPDGHIGRNTAPLLLLSRPEVQADLKLSGEVVASADRAITDVYSKAQALRGRRDSEAVAARRAVDEAQRTWLERNLSESQRERLAQLNLQWEGPSALHSRSLVAAALNLTEVQRRKLSTAIADREGKRRIAGRDSRADDVALGESVFAMLSEDQKTRWKSMLGPACLFRLASTSPASTAPGAATK